MWIVLCNIERHCRNSIAGAASARRAAAWLLGVYQARPYPSYGKPVFCPIHSVSRSSRPLLVFAYRGDSNCLFYYRAWLGVAGYSGANSGSEFVPCGSINAGEASDGFPWLETRVSQRPTWMACAGLSGDILRNDRRLGDNTPRRVEFLPKRISSGAMVWFAKKRLGCACRSHYHKQSRGIRRNLQQSACE